MVSKSNISLFQNDLILEKIGHQISTPEIISTKEVFHDLVSCILEQQIHYRSTKKIFAKALERAGIEYLDLNNFHLFEKFSLSQIKLATNKYETLNLFVEYWYKNSKDFSLLSEEEVIYELSTIKGIGKWTIDMILLFTLQRPNVFPCDDFHLKQIMVSLYGLDEKIKLKTQMIDIAEKWETQKSLAVLYLLEWKRQGKSLK